MTGARLELEISPRWEEESAGLHRLFEGKEQTKLRQNVSFLIILTGWSTLGVHRLRSRTSRGRYSSVPSVLSRGEGTITQLKMLLHDIVRQMLSAILVIQTTISRSILMVQSTTSTMESGSWTRKTLTVVILTLPVFLPFLLADLSSPRARTPALEVRLRLFMSSLYNNLSILSQLPGSIRSGLVTIISLI